MFSIQTRTELKRGNPEAFKEVFLVLYPRLRGYCRLFFVDNTLVEDIIQETFLTLWEKRELILPDKTVESFIFVMVRNRCLNELRKLRMETGHIDPENLKVADLQHLYQLDFNDREEKSLEEMLVQSFQQAVNELPEKMKLVFIRCKIEGKNQKEVAEDLGITVKMVEKHIARAKQHIREKLLKQYPALVTLVLLFSEH